MNGISYGEIAAALLTFTALSGATVWWWKHLRPGIRAVKSDARKIRDTLVGRDAEFDSITGEEKSPELPGIGIRMSHQERQMELLAITVTKLVDQQVGQLALSVRVDEHDERLRTLESAQVERVITRAESAQAWQTMEAAINADPHPDHPVTG